MKKVLLTLVVIAIAVSFSSAAFSEETTTIKTKTKETPAGTVTKEKGKVVTSDSTEKFKMIKITNGQFTTEKGKIIKIDNPNLSADHGIRVEELKFKAYNDKDNTVVFLKGQDEVVKPAVSNKVNHLKNAKTGHMKVYSTYDIMDAGWKVIEAEVLDTPAAN